MYYSKKNGGGRYTTYNTKMSDELLKRSLLERDLRAAIEYDEIDMYYLPKFSIPKNEINGFEALFR
jgi:predicted signal transduction protein with EAL and GGDEF domain